MNFVGKILIVVQVVLSLLFMAFAGAVFTVQTNWKTRATDLATQMQEMETSKQQRITDLSDEKTKMDQDLKTAQDESRRFQAAANALQNQLTQEQGDHRKVRESLAQQTEIARINGDEAEERRKESTRLRAENNRLIAVTDDQARVLREKDDSIYSYELQAKAKSKKHITLLKEAKNLKDFIASHDLRYDPREIQEGKTLPPVVTGVVVDTRKNKRGQIEMIQISLGSDDGLVRGHVLSAYRTGERGKYLGEVKIVNVTADKAVGVLIERAKNGIIGKGDNVTTKL